MRKILIIIAILHLLVLPVSALELSPPEAPNTAEEFMPPDTESFSEGLWYICKLALNKLHPALVEAAAVCLSALVITMLCGILQDLSADAKRTLHLVCTVALAVILFEPANALVQLGVSTVRETVDYGKLLLPAMTGAMAAQGGPTTSAALYCGTALFSTLLSSAIGKLLIPLVYVSLFVSVCNSALGQDQLRELQKLLKWVMTWMLKIILYIFTGYMAVTGAISGSVDAAAIKAAKLTISGTVPVVGGIIADASETILVSAGIVKNGIGVYGMLAVLSILIGPFIRIGAQYLLLKMTGAVCGMFGIAGSKDLIKGFSDAMGFLLAMLGAVGLLLMVSVVCFMKGIG